MPTPVPSSHLPLPLSALLLIGTSLLPCGGCADRDIAATGDSSMVTDRPLAEHRTGLLDLAMQAASAIPVDPHAKTRSRAQEQVVATCLGLGLPRRAERYLQEIDDWRRGAAHADLAFHYAERGAIADVERHLDRASRIADASAAGDEFQPWRRDRIRARIARTYVRLGRFEAAAQYETGIADDESGPVEVARAAIIRSADFDRQVEVLDAVLATGNFDSVRPALESCVRLFDRFYIDPDRRAGMAERVTRSYRKLPPAIRVEMLSQLIDAALAHDDRETARSFVPRIQELLDEAPRHPEHGIPLQARLAMLRFRTGDVAVARSQIDAVLARFQATQREIADIYRGGVLRAVATAYHEMGDAATARLVIGKAVEAGVANPNSRPRAEDLVANCTLLARLGIAKDPALHTRLLQIRAGLGHPW